MTEHEPTAPDLMTVEDAARMLNCSADDVRRMIDSGMLAGRQTRDGMRLNRKDVETQRNRPLESPDGRRAGE